MRQIIVNLDNDLDLEIIKILEAVKKARNDKERFFLVGQRAFPIPPGDPVIDFATIKTLMCFYPEIQKYLEEDAKSKNKSMKVKITNDELTHAESNFITRNIGTLLLSVGIPTVVGAVAGAGTVFLAGLLGSMIFGPIGVVTYVGAVLISAAVFFAVSSLISYFTIRKNETNKLAAHKIEMQPKREVVQDKITKAEKILGIKTPVKQAMEELLSEERQTLLNEVDRLRAGSYGPLYLKNNQGILYSISLDAFKDTIEETSVSPSNDKVEKSCKELVESGFDPAKSNIKDALRPMTTYKEYFDALQKCKEEALKKLEAAATEKAEKAAEKVAPIKEEIEKLNQVINHLTETEKINLSSVLKNEDDIQFFNAVVVKPLASLVEGDLVRLKEVQGNFIKGYADYQSKQLNKNLEDKLQGDSLLRTKFEDLIINEKSNLSLVNAIKDKGCALVHTDIKVVYKKLNHFLDFLVDVKDKHKFDTKTVPDHVKEYFNNYSNGGIVEFEKKEEAIVVQAASSNPQSDTAQPDVGFAGTGNGLLDSPRAGSNSEGTKSFDINDPEGTNSFKINDPVLK